jgi:hypothetical protein
MNYIAGNLHMGGALPTSGGLSAGGAGGAG